MTKEMFWKNVRESIESVKARGAWDRGVKDYAFDIVDTLQEAADYVNEDPKDIDETEAINLALNGAKDWNQYSWGGCSLCYNGDICDRLCSPSQQKRYKHGAIPPNVHEEWLDIQTRALYQAWNIVRKVVEEERIKYSKESA